MQFGPGWLPLHLERRRLQLQRRAGPGQPAGARSCGSNQGPPAARPTRSRRPTVRPAPHTIRRGRSRRDLSYGVRNPWRFSFDRLTGAFLRGRGRPLLGRGQLRPGGQCRPGVNFGWSECEGLEIYSPSDPFSSRGSLRPHRRHAARLHVPAHQRPLRDHGGYVARDHSLGSLYGRFSSSRICARDRSTPRRWRRRRSRLVSTVPITVETPSTFGEDACGRLYIAEARRRAVYRIVGETPATCGAAPPVTDPAGRPAAGRPAVRGPAALAPTGARASHPEPRVQGSS